MSKTRKPSFLFRHRYLFGYLLLAVAIAVVLLGLPLLVPGGLSEAEVESATVSFYSLPLIDLPYHLLQRFSIAIFGLTPYAIKLPSILIGLLTALSLTLLLTRWFKNNVALLAAVVIILSPAFLYLAGSGTPLIMLIFWPTLLLWAGSRIQGEQKPRSRWCFIFALLLLASLFTPYMPYFALFVVIFVLASPHLRFVARHLPKIPLCLIVLLTLAGLALFCKNFYADIGILQTLIGTTAGSLGELWHNFVAGFAPFFLAQNSESVWITPLFGVAILGLAFVGLFSTVHNFFASRNALASWLLVATALLSALNPEASVLLILPIAILVAHGFRYVFERWYGLFPENPYARVFALFPIATLIVIILISQLTGFLDGYRYNPNVATEFSDDLALVRANLATAGDLTLFTPTDEAAFWFYQILTTEVDVPESFHVIQNFDEITTEKIAVFGEERVAFLATADAYGYHIIPQFEDLSSLTETENQTTEVKNDTTETDDDTTGAETAIAGNLFLENYDTAELTRIITSSKSAESDRIYVYTLTKEENGN